MSKKGSFTDKPTKIKVGDSFEFNSGRYEVIELLNERWGNNERKYKVRFPDFNYEVVVTPTNIKNGRIRNPFFKSVAGVGYLGNVSHKHFLYNRWRSMISRCYSETDKDYMSYGAKGIKVCDEWHCFETYINNDRYYSFDTCKWVTVLENIKEQYHRNYQYFECIRIEDNYKEITNSPIDFSRKYGLNNDCITNCLRGVNKTHKGWKFKYIDNTLVN